MLVRNQKHSHPPQKKPPQFPLPTSASLFLYLSLFLLIYFYILIYLDLYINTEHPGEGVGGWGVLCLISHTHPKNPNLQPFFAKRAPPPAPQLKKTKTRLGAENRGGSLALREKTGDERRKGGVEGCLYVFRPRGGGFFGGVFIHVRLYDR